MLNAVYLMCSLPSLSFGKAPSISLDEFNDMARTQLTTNEMLVLQSIDIRNVTSEAKGDIQHIASMVDDLGHDLAEIRKAISQNRTPRLMVLPPKIIALNPLEREQQIMQWQWDKLDILESGKTFTFTQVVIYKLKLQILCRLNSFNETMGAEVLASVVSPSLKTEEQWQY